MVPDVMHDVLEGVAPYEVKEMIKLMVSNGYFTLTELNAQISNFAYAESDLRSKPSVIPSSTLSSNDHKLNQEAAQMWTLLRLLPLIIGREVPEEDPHWENFLILITILDYLMAPIISQDHIAFIRCLIDDHHIEFSKLYPNCSITPKFHYMVHYPEYISR
jgi:hypothetical protein